MTSGQAKRKTRFWFVLSSVAIAAALGAGALVWLGAPKANADPAGDLGRRLPFLMIAAGGLGVIGLLALLRAINAAMADRLKPPP